MSRRKRAVYKEVMGHGLNLIARRKTRHQGLQIAVSISVVQYISSHVFVFGEKSQVIIEQGRHIFFTELAAICERRHEFEEIQVIRKIRVFGSYQFLNFCSVGGI